MPVGLFTPVQGVHLQKEAIVFEDLLLLVMSISGLHMDLGQLENEATPQFTPVAILEPSCVSFFCFLEWLSSSKLVDYLKTYL